MENALNIIANSPVLALFGSLVLLALLLAPIVLRLAGLSGAQIIELLRATLAFVLSAISELRKCDPPQP